MDQKTTHCDVGIVGAGPYGLSIAAHLKALGVNFRIFGTPMNFWLKHMPKGMHLKSEGFASTLYDPGSTFTLEAYCKEKEIPYSHMGLPVPLDVFSAYGLEFQKRLVPQVENKMVEAVRQTPEGFTVRVEGGETFSARRVVIAIGLTNYQNMPPNLATLPEEFVTHSSRHNTVDEFKGSDVAVIGGGASALDLAAVLYEAGARVEVISREPIIRFHDPPAKEKPSPMQRIRVPMTGIGPGWKLFWCVNAPLIFRKMPQEFRLDRVRRILGPAPCWFTKEQVLGKVGLNVGTNVTDAKVENGRVRLQLTDKAGAQKTLVVDHVISATGYKVDLRRLSLMDSDLQSKVQTVENTPVLSSNFESTVPGLYFVGASAANTFGPLLRFAFGAGFTAKRISKHLARTADRKAKSSSLAKTEDVADNKEMAVR